MSRRVCVLGLCVGAMLAQGTAVLAADSYCATDSPQHAFYLPDIADTPRFLWVSPGSFVENNDGTAKLTGVIYSKNVPNNQFIVDVTFSGRVNPGDAGYPPTGSPMKELNPAEYVENGGTIDTSTWHYYLNLNGTLTGAGGYAGALITIVPKAGAPVYQVGQGASGQDLNFGASCWVEPTIVTEPTAAPFRGPFVRTADININLNVCCTSDDQCDDGEVCTEDTCDTASGQCVNTDIEDCCTVDDECDDGDECTEDTCDVTTGECKNEEIPGCGECVPELCVKFVCKKDGTETPVTGGKIGIWGPKIDGWWWLKDMSEKCMTEKICPGMYKVVVAPPHGYKFAKKCSWFYKFNLDKCEKN